MVPAQAAASAAYNIDTHMAHRERIYEFPVPWCNVNWGVRGEHLDDPATVQYLVLDRNLVERRRDRALLSDLLSGEFSIVSENQRHPGRQARCTRPHAAGAQPTRGRVLPAPGARQLPARPAVGRLRPRRGSGRRRWRAGSPSC